MNKYQWLPRVSIDVFLILFVFIFPWWLTILAAAIATFFFPYFIEVLFIGLFIDSLYNAPVAHIHNFQFIVTLMTLILFVGSIIIRKRIRFYRR